jgi:hypothetical protein
MVGFWQQKTHSGTMPKRGLVIRYSDARRENAHNIYQPLFTVESGKAD